jgi:hypothetical protein
MARPTNDQQPESPRPAPAPLTEQASNGERVPAEGETAESLLEHAEEHPASDASAGAEHADTRRSEDPAGIRTSSEQQSS